MRSPYGYADAMWPLDQPAVTTIAPGLIVLFELMKSSSSALGLPASGSTTPSGPLGRTCAETALVWSVISVTSDVPPVVAVTLPTSPSPVTTGSLARTPSPEPTSIVTLEYQTVGERPMMRPV